MPRGYVRADVYDAIYTQMKDYRAEASEVLDQVRLHIPRLSRELSLLDVACGTGLHLQYFAMWFREVWGVDLSPIQLDAARKRLPKRVQLSQGNMLSLVLADVGKEPTFDVVTCLFSAIGHMQTVQELQEAIEEMAGHLNPGGVLFVEPGLTPETWQPGHISLETVDKDDFKVTRISRSTLEGRTSTLEMHYTVGTPDGIEDYVEVMPVTLFLQEEYEEAFRRAGLAVEFDKFGLSPNGRGLYVGTKPVA